MNRHASLRSFRTACIWIGTAAGAFLLWQIRMALLLGFAAVLGAILFRLLARFVSRLSHLPDGFGLAAATLLVTGSLIGAAALFGAQLWGEFGELVPRIRGGEQTTIAYLNSHGFGQAEAIILNPAVDGWQNRRIRASAMG
jgi:predicted PurR-regulated permease PerM